MPTDRLSTIPADFQPGAAILIVSPDGDVPLRAKVLRKHPWGCDCGGAAYHVEFESGRHGDFCTSVIRRPN